MEQGLCALLVDNVFDYAVVAAAQSLVRTRLDGATPIPILNDGKLPAAFSRVLEHYEVRAVRFADIVDGEHPRARARALLGDQPEKKPVSISSSASLPQLGVALACALAESRPLDLEGNEPAFSWPSTGGRAGHRLVVREDSHNLLPAVLYAHATGKELWVVKEWSELEPDEARTPLASLAVVDEYRSFTKPFIEKLVCWSQDRDRGFPLGLLTAYSEYELSALVWRLLAHVSFHAAGKRSGVPAPGQIVFAKDMGPLEFYVLEGHGNERHLQHGQKEVLCGAFDAAVRRKKLSFDCDVECPYAEARVRTSDIPAHNIAILSCDTVTLGDGLVPAELTVALNCLNGWATSIIAPFKHAMVNKKMVTMTDALFRSGYSLGETVLRLNALGRSQGENDTPCVLLGDPERVVCPWGSREQPLVERESVDGGEVLRFGRVSGHVAETPVPAAVSSAVWGVVPEREVQPTTLFTFCNLPREEAPRLLLFSESELPSTMSVRMAPVPPLDQDLLGRYQEALRQISRLTFLGFSAEVVQSVEKQLLDYMRLVIVYPAAVELLATGKTVESIKQQTDQILVSARQQLLTDIINKMAKGPVWISHLYGHSFPQVSKVPSREGGAVCQFCSGSITRWLYEDPVTMLSGRHVLICSRCGIVADHPADKRLELAFDTEHVPAGMVHDQGVTVTNCGDSPLELSLFVQVNGWEKQGIICEPLLHEVELRAGESQRLAFHFEMEMAGEDELLAMQAFALTERFDLYSFVWKFPMRRRLARVAQPEQASR